MIDLKIWTTNCFQLVYSPVKIFLQIAPLSDCQSRYFIGNDGCPCYGYLMIDQTRGIDPRLFLCKQVTISDVHSTWLNLESPVPEPPSLYIHNLTRMFFNGSDLPLLQPRVCKAVDPTAVMDSPRLIQEAQADKLPANAIVASPKDQLFRLFSNHVSLIIHYFTYDFDKFFSKTVLPLYHRTGSLPSILPKTKPLWIEIFRVCPVTLAKPKPLPSTRTWYHPFGCVSFNWTVSPAT